MRKARQQGSSRHGDKHSASIAAQLYGWARLVTCSAAVLFLLAWASPPAAAQSIKACENLDKELVTLGKANPTYRTEKTNLEKAAKPEPGDERAIQLELDGLATKPSPLLANMGKTISGPRVTLVTFEDKRIDGLVDASKVCIKAFARPDGSNQWSVVPIQQVFLSEKSGDKPKQLNVVVPIDGPPNATPFSPSADVKYLFVGALTDATPTDATPVLSFSFSQIASVTSTWYAFALSLLFVAAVYLILAWITYNEETKSVKGPAWLAYTLSPIRISAAWFGEASMSQVQLLVFTFIVAGLLFYHWWTARVLAELSTNLLMLIGISAVGTGASKFAQTVKTSLSDQTARYLIGKGWYNWEQISARSHATLRKLLLTDGRLDIYKFQMAIFTVVVACYVISAGQASLVDVKISETMLYLIGISQGVYVGGKAVTDRTTDLEAAVQKMIDLDSQIRASEAKLAAGAARPPELVALDDQYAKAATTAVVEFTALQNRKFPTKFEFAKRRINDLGPQVNALQAKVASGATLTSDEQALKKEFEQVDMTAKEFEAFKEPDQHIAVQDIKNIDPAILRR